MHWAILVVAALTAGWGIVLLRPPARFLEANVKIYRCLWGWLVDMDETRYYSWSVFSGLFSFVVAFALFVWFIAGAVTSR